MLSSSAIGVAATWFSEPAKKRSLREDTERGGQESLGYGTRIKQAAKYKHSVSL